MHCVMTLTPCLPNSQVPTSVSTWPSSLTNRSQKDRGCVGSSALEEPNVTEFDITGRPMKGWIMVEAEGVETDEQLQMLRRLGGFEVQGYLFSKPKPIVEFLAETGGRATSLAA